MHIVHLEDEADLLEGMRFVIHEESPDTRLQQFSNSEAMASYVEGGCASIDLFILDVRVPGRRNGLEMARLLRDLGCDGEIVVTSAFEPPDDNTVDELRIHYFRKPWDLPETIRRMLEHARRSKMH